MKKTARKILTRLDRMKKAEMILAISWIAAMLIGVVTVNENQLIGSYFFIAAIVASLMGGANEMKMSRLQVQLNRSSRESQITAP